MPKKDFTKAPGEAREERRGHNGSLQIVTLLGIVLVFLQLEDSPFSKGLIPRERSMQSSVQNNSNTAVSISSAPLSPLYSRNDQFNNTKSCPSPSFTNQGAVFVFFHLAKAGGTSVRGLFRNLPNTVTLERIPPDAADPEIRAWLTSSTETRNLFVELHDQGNPSVQKMRGHLEDWRKLAALNHNKPLFIFTVVREPLSYALSFFTYMNVGSSHLKRYHHWELDHRIANLTFQSLLDFTLPSPQCLFYSRGEAATTIEFPIHGFRFDPVKECPEVYETMTRYFDWIGTIETMQKQLLPLLAYLASNDAQMGLTQTKQNAQAPKTAASNFTRDAKNNATTMETLKARLGGDIMLYKQVLRTYQWESQDWESCWTA